MDSHKLATSGNFRTNISIINKNNLSKSNFNFGSSQRNFKTISHTEFDQKPPLLEKNIAEKKIFTNIRTHSYKMGDHSLDYISDNKQRYSNPNIKKKTKYI